MDQDAPESVHLCDYPDYHEDWINEKIIKQVDALKQMVELGRSARNKSKQKIRQPEDIGKMILFLCSDEASYITGQTFYIDGGMSLN